MIDTMRKPTIWTGCPTLFDKWHGIFYMLSRTDTAGHTKVFIYTQSWGEQARGQRGVFGGRDPPPPALDHQLFFSTNFLTIAKKINNNNRSEYSMDAMYLNLMFINPSGPPPPVGAGALCTPLSLPPPPPPAHNPGSAPGERERGLSLLTGASEQIYLTPRP